LSAAVGKYGSGGGKPATATLSALRTESAKCSSRCGPAETEDTNKHSIKKNRVLRWSNTFEIEWVEAKQS